MRTDYIAIHNQTAELFAQHLRGTIAQLESDLARARRLLADVERISDHLSDAGDPLPSPYMKPADQVIENPPQPQLPQTEPDEMDPEKFPEFLRRRREERAAEGPSPAVDLDAIEANLRGGEGTK